MDSEDFDYVVAPNGPDKSSTSNAKVDKLVNVQLEKATEAEWLLIEKPLSPAQQLVMKALKDMTRNKDVIGNTDSTTSTVQDHDKEHEKHICGDTVYHQIREQVAAFGLCSPTVIKKEKETDKKLTQGKPKKNLKKKGITVEQGRIQNKLRLVKQSLDSALDSFSWDHLIFQIGFRSPYYEICMVTFMYCCQFYLRLSANQEGKCYDLIRGIHRALSFISGFKTVSATCTNDLVWNLDMLKAKYTYSNRTCCIKYPKAFYTTQYDYVFEATSVQPHDSQLKFAKCVWDEFEPSTGIIHALIMFMADVGVGKTSTCIRYCGELLYEHRENNPKSTIKILFVCSSDTVRVQAANLGYNENIPVGLVHVRRDTDEAVIIPNFKFAAKKQKRIDPRKFKNMNDQQKEYAKLQEKKQHEMEYRKNSEMLHLLVADLYAARKLLDKGDHQYILVVDEPTIGADQENNEVTRNVAQLLSHPNLPPSVILMSATLPPVEQIPNIVEYYKSKYPNNKVHTIYSNESIIGCEYVDPNGTTILPHCGCQTIEELQQIVSRIQQQAFASRCYTAPIAFHIRDRLLEHGVTEIVDLEQFFSDTSKITQSHVQNQVLQMFQQVIATNDDDMVAKICQPLVLDINNSIVNTEIEVSAAPEPEDDSDSDSDSDKILWDAPKESVDKAPDAIKRTVNFDLLATSDSYIFTGGLLVATNSPIEMAKRISTPLFACHDLNYRRIMAKYHADKSMAFDNQERATGRILNPDLRSQKEQSMKEENVAKIRFPEYLRINTRQHLNHFAPHMKGKYPKSWFAKHALLPSFPDDFAVPGWVMLCLWAGIGIYAPTNPLLDRRYMEHIVLLAVDGLLPIIVADDSISFGINFPFSGIAPCKDLIEAHSDAVMRQLLGRAGRSGLAYCATVYTDEYTAGRIHNYFHSGQQGVTEEAKNIVQAFDEAVKQRQESAQEQKDKKLTVFKTCDDDIVCVGSGGKKPVLPTKETPKDEWKMVEKKKSPPKKSNVYVPPKGRRK